MTIPVTDWIQLGTLVTSKPWDKHRDRGVVIEVHPFGEFLVKWDRIKRPELVICYNLERYQ